MKRALLAVVMVAAGPVCAQTVSMSGAFGDKALLVIDGTPSTVATGATVRGVKLVSVSANGSVVEMQGKRVPLTIGGAQVNLGGSNSEGGGSQIVLTATTGGHFVTDGTINGRPVRFLVDTGATFVSMGADQARDLGLDYTKGERGFSNTANGVVPVYRVKLNSIRVGDVQLYNVDGLVSQSAMPAVLLGNSFLTRFQMKRENDTMTLTRRY